MSERLRAIGWDHPRCRAPMEAAGVEWRRRGGAAIEWSFRPLSAFNDQPIDEISRAYDILVIDHPMAPAAADAGCIVPLDVHLPAAGMDPLAASAVGPSHDSYSWDGHQWALAVDAACHVSCCRPDLMAHRGLAAPTSWDDVLAMAAGGECTVALPLLPADAICALITIAATRGTPLRLDAAVDRESVALLCQVAAIADPRSFELAPPQLLDHMARHDDIAYMPLTFGYSAFARATGSDRAQLQFGPIPSAGHGPAGAILGGAGVAVSASCSDVDAAVAFAAWVCSLQVQASVILPAGGQPAARAVWRDPSADTAAGGFFSRTVTTIEAATVRPRHPRWPSLQRELGERIAQGLRRGERAGELAASLDKVIASATPAREVSA